MTDADGDSRGAGDRTAGREEPEPPSTPTDGVAATDPTGSGGGTGTRDRRDRPVYAPPDDDSFDWRGWSLVALVFVCFLAVPGAILLLPGAGTFLGSLGLSLRDAYLTLPLIPAVVLGLVAVWSAVASRRS